MGRSVASLLLVICERSDKNGKAGFPNNKEKKKNKKGTAQSEFEPEPAVVPDLDPPPAESGDIRSTCRPTDPNHYTVSDD